MYRYLWSNGPKEGLEFADYSFEEHFGKQIASYPPRAVQFDYIEGSVKKAGVRDWIRFSTTVRMVKYNADKGNFTVIVHDLKNDCMYDEVFDYVIVASGHFSVPNCPEYSGFDTFNGRVLHAHDFRDAREFAGKDMLLLGPSYLAEDIGSQCWKYGAKSITVAYRNAPMGFKWPDNWKESTGAGPHGRDDSLLQGRHFEEGRCRDPVRRLQASFPFLPNDLRLKTAIRLATTDLYKGVAWVHNPKLFFIGMQDQWFTFNMFDAQAWWVRDAIMERISIPADKKLLRRDVADRIEGEDAGQDAHDAINYQGHYVKELIAETDYPSFDVDGACEAFFKRKEHKKAGIIDFRNNAYKSIITGTMAPVHHTPWKDALEDSMKSYLHN